MFSDDYTYTLHGPKGNWTVLPQVNGVVDMVKGPDLMSTLPDEVRENLVADYRTDAHIEKFREAFPNLSIIAADGSDQDQSRTIKHDHKPS